MKIVYMAHSCIEEYLRPTILPNIWMDPWSNVPTILPFSTWLSHQDSYQEIAGSNFTKDIFFHFLSTNMSVGCRNGPTFRWIQKSVTLRHKHSIYHA